MERYTEDGKASFSCLSPDEEADRKELYDIPQISRTFRTFIPVADEGPTNMSTCEPPATESPPSSYSSVAALKPYEYILPIRPFPMEGPLDVDGVDLHISEEGIPFLTLHSTVAHVYLCLLIHTDLIISRKHVSVSPEGMRIDRYLVEDVADTLADDRPLLIPELHCLWRDEPLPAHPSYRLRALMSTV